MTTKTKAIIAAAVGGIALLALLGGGPPDVLEVKGLRLGMPIEEAARVMLGHGMPPGGSAEWDPAGSRIYVASEYGEALKAHYRSVLEPKFQAAGAESLGEYLAKTLTPEQFQKAHDEFSALPYLQPESAHLLVSRWEELGLPPFLEADQLFPEMETYLAQKYPGGPPYDMGGPWDGQSPLKLRGGELQSALWTMHAGEDGTVDHIQLATGAVNWLFGAGDATGEEFAASFSSAYGVPLEFYADAVSPDLIAFAGTAFRTGWACVNRDGGWALSISEHKVLEIRAVTPAAKQSFD
jgi:hypothetical protein